jgi:hypothetical protein
MSTQAQLEANRENATHSTGPTSDAGRATCSQNSLKHGLASCQLLIPGESEEEFNTFLAELITDHQPTTVTETLLVQDMAKFHWLADRALRMQNRAIALEGNDVPKTLAVLIRYQTANQRAFDKSYATLLTTRKEAAKSAIGSASKSSKPAPAPPPPDTTFVHTTVPSVPEILEMFTRGYEYNYATNRYDKIEAA